VFLLLDPLRHEMHPGKISMKHQTAGAGHNRAAMSKTHQLGHIVLAIAAFCGACGGSVFGGDFYSDFDSGQPLGTTLFGNGYVDSTGGMNNSGALKLTTAYNYGAVGYLLIDDLDGGAPVTSFSAMFRLLIGNGEGADGFSFNFASDLPNGLFTEAEEGTGTGLIVSFDTFDNGGGEAPGIDVKAGGVTLGTTRGNLGLFRTNGYLHVWVNLRPDGRLDLFVDGKPVFQSLFIPLLPSAGRFGLAARTGGLSDNHWVDELSITTSTKLPDYPTVRYVFPAGNAVRGDTGIKIAVVDGIIEQLKPDSVRFLLNYQEVIPSITTNPGFVILTYQLPSLLPPASSNTVVITYSDTAGNFHGFGHGFNVAPMWGRQATFTTW
jgi:hypothetical protein